MRVAVVARTAARQPLGDLLAGAEQQHAAAELDHVAEPQDAKLHVLVVDLRAVGAFQVGDHQAVVIFLNLDVIPADPLVVELDRVALFAADGDRRIEILKDAAPVGAVEHADRDAGHGPGGVNRRGAGHALSLQGL